MVEQDAGKENAGESRRMAKKAYQEPAFRHERVFETMALSCGKIEPTSFSCIHKRMSS
ncbi:MAG: hypothetical protein WA416_03880 [Candidatus Sulfotelmatobacter sp.]